MLPVQTQAQMRIVMTNDNTADFAIDEIRIFLLLISKYLWLRINHRYHHQLEKEQLVTRCKGHHKIALKYPIWVSLRQTDQGLPAFL